MTPLPVPAPFAPFRALRARLLAAPSATRALEAWCAEHGIGDSAVRVQRVPTAAVPPDGETLALLRPGPGEIPQHRRVLLLRGGVALSEAENWFLPQRLPPAMRHALDTTDLPFGVVVEPLRPTRRTLRAELGAEGLLLRAVVLRDGDRPIAMVHERYLPTLAPVAAAPGA